MKLARLAVVTFGLLLAAASWSQTITGLSVSPAIARSGSTTTGTVAIGNPAPPAGTSIAIFSNDPTIAAIPSAAFIPGGATKGTFSIAVQNPSYNEITAIITAATNILERTVNVTILPANYSTFVGQTVPTNMVVGVSYPVSLQFKNTGGTTWESFHHYKLQSCNPVDNTNWGTTRIRLQDASVAPGQTGTFAGSVTAPTTPGTYNFQWRCVQDSIYDPFGALSTNVVITVNAGTDDASFIGQTVPASVYAGALFSPTMTFKNVGTSTWTVAGGYALQSRNPYLNTTWGFSTVPLPSSIAPQATITFSPTCTAPTTPGTYSFAWFMVHGSGFGQIPPAVNIIVTPPDNGVFVSQIVPTSVSAGAQFIPQFTFKNTGTSVWSTATKYWLVSQAPKLNTKWGLSRAQLPANAIVAHGAVVTFLPHLTAPTVPGAYFMQWQMSDNDTEFGQRSTGVGIQVIGVGIPEDAQWTGQTVPVLATAGQHYIAQVTFKNIGTANWPLNTAVGVYPQPDSSWALNYLRTNSVITVGNSTTYTLDLVAPYLSGNHSIQFRMRDLNTNTWFGQIGPAVVVSVAPSIYAETPWAGYMGSRGRGTGRGYGSGAIGQIVWDTPIPLNGAVDNSSISSPAIGTDGTIYFGNDNSSFYALDGATGAVKWSFVTGNQVWSCPCIGSDGTVYFGSQDHNVYALDGQTGAVKWSYTTGNQIGFSSPRLSDDGTLFIGSDDGYMYALNSSNGTLKWKYNVGGPLRCTPVVYNNTIYFGSNGGTIYALNASTGSVIWTHTDINWTSLALAMGYDGTLYYGTFLDKSLNAINGSNGQAKWKIPLSNYEMSPPSIGPDGTIYVASNDHLYAISPVDGHQIWSVATTARNWADSPTIASDGTIYYSSNFALNAYDGRTGATKWSLNLFTALGPVALGADGNIYVCAYGHAYRIK